MCMSFERENTGCIPAPVAKGGSTCVNHELNLEKAVSLVMFFLMDCFSRNIPVYPTLFACATWLDKDLDTQYKI